MGLALLAGAVGAFYASTRPELSDVVWAIGISIGTLIVGLGAVIVGLARRRSGFLAFLGILGVLGVVGTVLIPQGARVLPIGASYSVSSTESARVIQLAGTTETWVSDRDPADPPVIDIWQATGSVQVFLVDGASVRIESVTADGSVYVQHFDDGVPVTKVRASSTNSKGESTVAATIGEGDTDAVIRIWLGSGSVWVINNDEGN
jgi:hypothetical protein